MASVSPAASFAVFSTNRHKVDIERTTVFRQVLLGRGGSRLTAIGQRRMFDFVSYRSRKQIIHSPVGAKKLKRRKNGKVI
jgi:hypothetical protein